MSNRNCWLSILAAASIACVLLSCGSPAGKTSASAAPKPAVVPAAPQPAVAARQAAEEDEADEADEAAEADEQDEADEAAEEHVAVITAAELPAAVRAALDKLAPGAKLGRVEKQTVEAGSRFEIDYTAGGSEQSATLTDKGETLELEREVPAASLPAAVSASLQKNFPGAKIHEATAVQRFYYEVVIEVNGHRREVQVQPNGAPLED